MADLKFLGGIGERFWTDKNDPSKQIFYQNDRVYSCNGISNTICGGLCFYLIIKKKRDNNEDSKE